MDNATFVKLAGAFSEKAKCLATRAIPIQRINLKDAEGKTLKDIVSVLGIMPKLVYEPGGHANGGGTVYYLKVNRDDNVALCCIQHWLDVIGGVERPRVYIVCDNVYLKHRIIKECRFPANMRVEFLRSRHSSIRAQCSYLHTKSRKWKRATYAHVYPFYHAKEHGYQAHWDIDADDTMFLLASDKVREALDQASKVAELEGLHALSLDMWWNRMRGRHWSFGVLYVNDTVDFCNIFDRNTSLEWITEFEEKRLDAYYNTDWYFTYLKNHEMARIDTFFIDNGFFAHWAADFIQKPLYGVIFHWSNGNLTFPVLENLFDDGRLGNVPILGCRRIDVGLDGSEASSFLRKEFGGLSDLEQRKYL